MFAGFASPRASRESRILLLKRHRHLTCRPLPSFTCSINTFRQKQTVIAVFCHRREFLSPAVARTALDWLKQKPVFGYLEVNLPIDPLLL
jgi:hypothetical protein